MSAAARLPDALAGALPAGARDAVARWDDALAIDGHEISVRLAPRTPEELADVLGAVCGVGGALLVRGSGSRLAVANPLRGADAVLETEALTGILELDADEGVAHVRAGTPLALVADAAREAGWELPLDPPEGGTLGGVLASAAVGPRWARPRQAVLGLEVVLASGVRTRCGGRVVKNVTGYDLAKLHTGAFGGLGVLASAWVRLRPRPEACRVVRCPLAQGDASAGTVALDAVRRPSARAALWTDEGLFVELAGDASAVAEDESGLREALGAEAASAEPLARAPSERRPGALCARLAVRASRLAEAVGALLGVGARVVAYPAHGLVYAGLALDARDPDDALAALRGAAATSRAVLRIEEAPLDTRRRHDVFAEAPSAVALVRALKQRFDPSGVLNPGRLPGGV